MKHLKDISDWEECINQVVCGDSLDLLKMIPDNAIDLCLTCI
jgi:DNA modification methylase